jgi:hypothetical protein
MLATVESAPPPHILADAVDIDLRGAPGQGGETGRVVGQVRHLVVVGVPAERLQKYRDTQSVPG